MSEIPVHKVNQNSSARFTARLLNTAELAIADNEIVSITMTLMNLDARDGNGDPAIINSRNATNVHNTGPGTFASPTLTIDLDPADNAMTDLTREVERHMLKLNFVYDTDKEGVSDHIVLVKRVPRES